MRIYRNKFDVIVIDLEGEKEISSIHVDTAGVLVVGEAIRPTKHALDAATPWACECGYQNNGFHKVCGGCKSPRN